MTAAKRLRLEREEALRLMNGDAPTASSSRGELANARKRAAMSRRALASVGGVNVDAGNDGGSGPCPSTDAAAAAETGDAKGGDAAPPRGDPREGDATPLDREDPADATVADDAPAAAAGAGTSLLEQAALLRKQRDSLSHGEQTALQRRQDEDRILKEASHVQTNALQAASELAVSPAGPRGGGGGVGEDAEEVAHPRGGE